MNNSVKIAIVLSGNGVFDGSEIHESVMTMWAVVKLGGEYQIFAPDMDQYHVINHMTGEEMPERRNVLIESARIARGKIKKLSELNMKDFDAIMFPGGFGAAKNLSDFAFKGSDCSVIEDVERVIKESVKLNKPIGALCISPVITAKVLEGVKVTVGKDRNTAEAIRKMGSVHENTKQTELIIDPVYKVVTTPCYMLEASISDIAISAENVTKAVFKLING
jgi:enhancing lycopene biosynthesis protein 2